MDHNLRKFPTNLESKTMSDINNFEKRRNQVVYNEIEINDYRLPNDND